MTGAEVAAVLSEAFARASPEDLVEAALEVAEREAAPEDVAHDERERRRLALEDPERAEATRLVELAADPARVAEDPTLPGRAERAVAAWREARLAGKAAREAEEREAAAREAAAAAGEVEG